MCAEGCGSSAEAFLRGRACGSSCLQKFRLSTVFEALSRKQIPKFSRKTLAKAAVEGGNELVMRNSQILVSCILGPGIQAKSQILYEGLGFRV